MATKWSSFTWELWRLFAMMDAQIKDILEGVAEGPECIILDSEGKPEKLPSVSALKKMTKADLIDFILEREEEWDGYITEQVDMLNETNEIYEDMADEAWKITAMMPV